MLNVDNAIGRLFKFKIPAYIGETRLSNEGGVYTAEDWSKARALGYREAGINSSELDDDESYLRRIFQVQYRNFLSAQRLCSIIDFKKYESVLELGCGEMVQGFVIKMLYPHLRYCATGFDPFIIAKCSRLSLFQSIEKKVLDVSTLKADDLQDFQMVLWWELFYALDDTKLSNIFGTLGDVRGSMIACTTQLTGPLRALMRRIKELPTKEQAAGCKGLRMDGWHHSLGYYQKLGGSTV